MSPGYKRRVILLNEIFFKDNNKCMMTEIMVLHFNQILQLFFEVQCREYGFIIYNMTLQHLMFDQDKCHL